MKKLKITAILFVLGASLALAQGPRGERPHEGMLTKHLERLDSIVDLTDDQKVKIEALNVSHKAKMKEARSSHDREAMKTLRQTHKAAIEAILTPAQRDTLKASKAAHRETMKEMKTELKKYKHENVVPTLKTKRTEFDNVLTEDEKATIAALKAEFKAVRKANKSAESPRGQKMDPEARKAMKAQMEAVLAPIVTAHKSELEQVESDLKPLRDTWKADTDAIKKKHVPTCDGDDCKGRKGKGHKKGKHLKSDQKDAMKYYRFLLMKFE
ncbi:MAG: hypothetical protein ACI9JN_001132 [Bacteroidia bacterium]|jgi:hypothetical protein